MKYIKYRTLFCCSFCSFVVKSKGEGKANGAD
uniref:Uncharacterized protein n=1 Tax=Siphoviridae sp. ctuvC1 TaxID=2826507 RepID=A0A8S5M047_9CAUD|nr:MAG TPA: hypothetical protein [Siphoviridae sp. ctuvC1]